MESNKSAEKKTVKTEEVKEAVSTAEKKKAAPSRTRKALETQEAKKETAPKKETEKKAAAPRKTAAKKAEPKAEFFIEYAGRQISGKEILEAAKKDYLSKNKDTAVKTLELYIKPEEHTAYYTVNGEGSDEYKVEL